MTDTLPTGFYPFWFWNDRLSADEIRWQVAEMARQGVRGFFIHSRQGLGQPYLSEAFFEMVDVAVAAAEEHGLVVHLYDEYPYPSGVAGGQVTLGQPQYPCDRADPAHLRRSGRAGADRAARGQGAVGAGLSDVRRMAVLTGATGVDLADHVGPLLVSRLLSRDRSDPLQPEALLRQPADADAGSHAARRPAPHLRQRPGRGDASQVLGALRRRAQPPGSGGVHRSDARTLPAGGTGRNSAQSIRSIFVDETQPGWSARLPGCIPGGVRLRPAANLAGPSGCDASRTRARGV